MREPTYWVQRREDHTWEVRKEGAIRPLLITKTQRAAWGEALHRARRTGGWIFLRSKQGHIRRQKKVAQSEKTI